MKIHYLQHVPFENSANIENWANSKQNKLSKTLLYENAKFPNFDCFDLLIILGGSMNIYEEDKYSWLKQEKEFIKELIKQDKYVLGICLGAQLLADALGAKVYPNNHKEIGWFPIKLTQEARNTELFKEVPETLNVFHWHGDTFELPDKSTLVASSEACANQGFIYNEKIIGLQFHLETSKISIENLIKNCNEDITNSKYIQTIAEMKEYEKINKMENVLTIFLNNLEMLITKEKNYVSGKN